MNPSLIEPARNAQRLPALDVLRGFAVMGILGMNIVPYAWPQMSYLSPHIPQTGSASDIWVYLASYVLIEGKMRGLFSLLFGASMLLVIDRAEAKGEDGWRVHSRRMLWLALFGLAHFFLIWFGDILFLYAIVGLIAFHFRNWEPGQLIKFALALFALGMVQSLLMYATPLAVRLVSEMPGAFPAFGEVASEMTKELDGIATKSLQEAVIIKGSWGGVVWQKLTREWHSPITMVVTTLLETLPLMMLGMALFKKGYLTGDREAAHYARRFWQFFLPGMALTLLLAWKMWAEDFDMAWLLAIFLGASGLPRLLLTMAWLSLLLLLWKRWQAAAFLARVGAAGRMAFSNYLGTSLVMTAIFYGWGLGLFGSVSRGGLLLFVAAAWLVMLAWSKPWLARYHYGPLEWLWRSLARGQRQPMRRNQSAPSS